MMAEKKRFEEEAKQKQIEAEMEQELKRQAQLKLQQQQNQKAVYEMFFYALLAESCFSLSTTCICNSSILKYLYYCRPFLRRPLLALFLGRHYKDRRKKADIVLEKYALYGPVCNQFKYYMAFSFLTISVGLGYDTG